MPTKAAEFDLLIRGGRVVDGTGNPWRWADVAVQGDRIVEVGLLPGAEARQVIDASGQVVSPGFVDMHSHADRAFASDRINSTSGRTAFDSLIIQRAIVLRGIFKPVRLIRSSRR